MLVAAWLHNLTQIKQIEQIIKHTDYHRFFWFRRQYEQYGQFIDIDKSKLIVNMKNIVLVVRVVFKKKVVVVV